MAQSSEVSYTVPQSPPVPRSRRSWSRPVLIAAVLVLVAVVALRGDPASEPDRLARLLGVEMGQTLADIGAGDGWLSIAMAETVGPAGHVFATELSNQRRAAIETGVAQAGLGNVSVVEAGVQETNLPAGCCDAIFMRRVYHHLSDAPAVNASLHQAVKPGGRLAIIELEPTGIWSPFKVWPHWTDDAQVVEEVEAAGFRHVATEDWPGFAHYVVVFER